MSRSAARTLVCLLQHDLTSLSIEILNLDKFAILLIVFVVSCDLIHHEGIMGKVYRDHFKRPGGQEACQVPCLKERIKKLQTFLHFSIEVIILLAILFNKIK